MMMKEIQKQFKAYSKTILRWVVHTALSFMSNEEKHEILHGEIKELPPIVRLIEGVEVKFHPRMSPQDIEILSAHATLKEHVKGIKRGLRDPEITIIAPYINGVGMSIAKTTFTNDQGKREPYIYVVSPVSEGQVIFVNVVGREENLAAHNVQGGLHVLAITEARIATAEKATIGFAGGLGKPGASRGDTAKREGEEELCLTLPPSAEELGDVEGVIGKLTSQIAVCPVIYFEVNVDTDDGREFLEKVRVSRGGLEEEGEFTKPVLVPVAEFEHHAGFTHKGILLSALRVLANTHPHITTLRPGVSAGEAVEKHTLS